MNLYVEAPAGLESHHGVVAVGSWLWGRGCGVVAVGSWLWGRGCGVVAVGSWLWGLGPIIDPAGIIRSIPFAPFGLRLPYSTAIVTTPKFAYGIILNMTIELKVEGSY